jgi:putative membrane protein
MMGWNGGGWWGIGMVIMGVFWVVVMAVVIWAVVRLSRSTRAGQGRDVESARQILDRRFALGESDAEQYAQMRRVLDGHGG